MKNIELFGQKSSSIMRSELKYVISEETAERFRRAAHLLMDLDPYAGSAGGTYPVHTIYLDSPDFAIYRKSLNREADRFKLRMRFYDDDPSSPVFLEIKQRFGGRGMKERHRVSRDAVSEFFSFKSKMNSSERKPFEQFWEAVSRFEVCPMIHIAYQREAFVGRDDLSTRLTMDRLVRFEPAPRTLATTMRNPIPIWIGKVILEVKFAEDMPAYLRDLIRSLGLETTKASKYIESVASMPGRSMARRVARLAAVFDEG